MKSRFILLFATLLITGCAFINVDMIQPLRPLKEQTIEGDGRAKVLLLDITGFISEKDRGGSQLAPEKPSTVTHVKESLQKAEKDPDIVGVILRINSPGGTVTASDIIYHELIGFKSRRNIPLMASITGIGASGAYYLASAADSISVHPTAITGSIGVVLPRFNLAGLLAKIGVSEHAVKSGEKKDILSPFRASTPEEDQIIQTIISTLHNRFLDVVMTGRGKKLSRNELQTLADGRIYTAEQALKANLVDKICYLDETIASLKEAKGLKEIRLINYSRPGSYRGTIYSSLPGDTAAPFSLINIHADGLDMLSNTDFLYLWQP
jgi:protease-4